MVIIGLTGVMGCGKSTVAGLLAELGAARLDADQLARQAIAPGSVGWQQVVDRFGRAMLAPDGGIDRTRLAEAAFGDDLSLAALEAIIHPAVQRLQAAFLASLAAGVPAVVLEIPLLFETHGQNRCDVTLAVTCGASQSRRLASRAGAAAVRQRMRARQLPEAAKQRLADYRIDNSGDLTDTWLQVRQLWPVLLAVPATAWPEAWQDVLDQMITPSLAL